MCILMGMADATPTATTTERRTLTLGANLVPGTGGEREFRVWAPRAQRVELKLQQKLNPPVSSAQVGHPQAEVIAMPRGGQGYFTLSAKSAAGDKYSYIVDGGAPLPDPVSRLLPDGVHGSTEIVDADAFAWTDDAWRGLPLCDYILYELHIGTFTDAGTFDGAIAKLGYLKNELGGTAI